MTRNEIKTRTVYCLTKRIADENYDVYVESTSMSLEKRLSYHKSDARQKRCAKPKIYQRMNEVGLNNWKIVPLLTLECTRDEIRSFERKWCEVLEADLNMRLPIISVEEVRGKKAEYYAANHQEVREKQAAYYAANLEKIQEKQAAYRAANREKIREKMVEYRAANREKSAAYYAANREKIQEKQAAYRARRKGKKTNNV